MHPPLCSGFLSAALAGLVGDAGGTGRDDASTDSSVFSVGSLPRLIFAPIDNDLIDSDVVQDVDSIYAPPIGKDIIKRAFIPQAQADASLVFGSFASAAW